MQLVAKNIYKTEHPLDVLERNIYLKEKGEGKRKMYDFFYLPMIKRA